jgi:anthranilate phosphoribosyltransferase
VRAALQGEPGPAADIVALNAGAAIYTAGLSETHEAGVRRAIGAMTTGAALRKLEEFVAFTRRFSN